MSDFVEIIDRLGHRRRARKGEILTDDGRFSLPMTFMDAQLRDELVKKYGRAPANRVVDAAGLPAGFRPGFLLARDNAFGASAAEAAYRERLDAKARKRRQLDDSVDGEDDDKDDVRCGESLVERRERLAKRAAQATMGSSEAQRMTIDQLQARAEAAYDDRCARMREAWRTR